MCEGLGGGGLPFSFHNTLNMLNPTFLDAWFHLKKTYMFKIFIQLKPLYKIYFERSKANRKKKNKNRQTLVFCNKIKKMNVIKC